MNKLDLSNTADRVIPRILMSQAEQNGDMAFLVTDAVRITFSQADTLTDSLAAGLREMGVVKGDIIALFLGNRPGAIP